jgi:iron complex outermembrane receptor protein
MCFSSCSVTAFAETPAPAPEPPGEAEQQDSDRSNDGVEDLVVTGRRGSGGDILVVDSAQATPSAPDTTTLLLHTPGADVVSNGPITGQVQYRGLFGSRINVVIDGMEMDTGGPNWMDPPLHYAPRPLVEVLELQRGIASVSSGLETMGGSVQARMLRSRFTEGPEFELDAELESGFRSVDEAYAGGGMLAVANDTFRVHVLGSAEFGSDIDSPDGRIHPTRHERYNAGGGAGIQLGDHRLGFDYRHNKTDDTGTPALPMDIDFVDTELVSTDYEGQLGSATLRGRFSFQDVDHRMTNFELRQPPMAAMFRFTDAKSRAYGWGTSGSVPLFTGELELGVDGHLSDHEANIFNPNNAAFFVNNFNGAERDRYGVYAEWGGTLCDVVGVELGARYTRVEMDAGKVDALPAHLMPAPRMLRDEFNAADRSKHENDFDWVVKLSYEPLTWLRFEVEAARKTRAPSYIERYAWLPLQASGGLADGHNYVGDLSLDPEVAHEVGGGFDLRWGPLSFSPRAFYRSVDDYIQGVPSSDPRVIGISSMSGDPNPLVFANVEAELYGVDADYVIALPWGFQLDGTLSWVRAKRRDIDDDLYRIAPLHGRTTLGYRAERWSVAIEGVYAAEQSKVSKTNGETATSGWGILNLFGSYSPWEPLVFIAGITNVADDEHRMHLAGINRVANSGVSPGQKIPGLGRNFFVRAHFRW